MFRNAAGKIKRDHVEIRHGKLVRFCKRPFWIQLIKRDTLASAVLRPVKERLDKPERNIIEGVTFILFTAYEKECDSALFLEVIHLPDLVLRDVSERV